MTLSTIEAALDALRLGRPVLVLDDEDRENEGDVVLAGQTLIGRASCRERVLRLV